MLDCTVDAIISSAQARCYENTSGLQPSDLVRILNEEITAYAQPMILEARQDYFTNLTDVPLVTAQQLYFLPDNATAMELRAIGVIDGSGNIVGPLFPITIEDVLSQSSATSAVSGAFPKNYFFQGSDQLSLWPPNAINSGYSIRMFFFQSPSELVLKAACLLITSITDNHNGTYTLGFAAANTTALFPGNVDLVKNRSPFTRQVANSAFSGGGSSVTSLTITGAVPSGIVVGDWITPTGQAPVFVGFPKEMVTGPLTQWLTVKLMEGRGDEAAFARAVKTLGVSEKKFKQYMRTRNTGQIQQATASTTKYKGGFAQIRRF